MLTLLSMSLKVLQHKRELSKDKFYMEWLQFWNAWRYELCNLDKSQRFNFTYFPISTIQILHWYKQTLYLVYVHFMFPRWIRFLLWPEYFTPYNPSSTLHNVDVIWLSFKTMIIVEKVATAVNSMEWYVIPRVSH